MTKRVLVPAGLPGGGIERLRAALEVLELPPSGLSGGALAEKLAGAQGWLSLLTQRVDDRTLSVAPTLEIIANCAVGVDNIDLEAARRRGVMVTHTPDVLTEDTADLTWGLILATTRRLAEGDRLVRRGEFEGWRPDLLLGRSLASLTLGVVGAGRIGRAVMRRGRALGVRVLYASRSPLPDDLAEQLGARRRELDELLRESDVVSLHVPLTAATRHLIDSRAIASMKPGSFLINTSRGPLVDEAALAAALRRGHLGGVGLDVFEREPEVEAALLEQEKAVLVPHLGSATLETRTRMVDCCCEDLITALVEGRTPERNLVTVTSVEDGAAGR